MNMLDKMSGFKPGELSVISVGRQAGKSMFTQQAIERLTRDLNSQPISDLILSEGRVYGARYYCVEPVGGNWLEMEQWATQAYGPGGSVWHVETESYKPADRWYANNRRFWFRYEADRTMFILKWR
jgi:hypothetical protein